MKGSGYNLCTLLNRSIRTWASIARGPKRVCVAHSILIQWSASDGVPSVFDFEPSSGLPIGLPLDCATACVGIGGVIYSNFRESRVNVTGPYIHP
jgi:hypothetical protein